MMDTPHRLSLRVYYEDTDAGGMVYHASWLRFAERARTEMMHALTDYKRMVLDADLAFVVYRLEMDCHHPGRLDDRLEVASRLTEIGTVRLSVCQEIRHGDQILASLHVRLACVDVRRGGRPKRIPRLVLESLKQ